MDVIKFCLFQDVWSIFNFKRPSQSSHSNIKRRKEDIEPIKKRKEDIDPHICLECGRELTWGRNSVKQRHWVQWHKNEPNKDYRALIVPKNHEQAINLLKNKNIGSINQTTSVIDVEDDVEELEHDDELIPVSDSPSSVDDMKISEVQKMPLPQEIGITETGEAKKNLLTV